MDQLRILWVLAITTALALCIVWQGAVIRKRGRRVERLERAIERMEADEQKLRAEIERLKSPQRIIGAALRLGLEQPASPPRPAFVPIETGAAGEAPAPAYAAAGSQD